MAMLPHLTGAASTSHSPPPPHSISLTPLPPPVETVAVTLWGGSEGAITIMAASIPVLRTLIRRDRTGTTTAARRYYGATDERRLNTTSLETVATTTAQRHGEKDVEVVTIVQVERS